MQHANVQPCSYVAMQAYAANHHGTHTFDKVLNKVRCKAKRGHQQDIAMALPQQQAHCRRRHYVAVLQHCGRRSVCVSVDAFQDKKGTGLTASQPCISPSGEGGNNQIAEW